MIGMTVAHYRIVERLGRGGMGEVFLAFDTRLKRKVALKFLPEEMRDDPTARKRLLREAESAATLDHPFICKIYEAAESDDHDYIAMEYIEGKTLKDRLSEEHLSLEDLVHKATEIADALGVAHEHGIVHRDLKPSNIMIDRSGHIKIMDFGLAKQVLLTNVAAEDTVTTALTGHGAIVGTIDYMAPEQLLGEDADARSDIFAFGIILYELLTGTHPFRKSSAAQTAHTILSDAHISLRHAVNTPPLLDHIIRRALARNPHDRYQSMRDLAADLRMVRAASHSDGERHLAAIMFTNMAGFTALAQRNETLAMQLLAEHWQILRTTLSKHAGQEIRAVADTCVVEFRSALEAVRCAVEIQRSLSERNAKVSAERQILLRIGLHLGDVIQQESDILGDGVNIASCLQPLAAPGGVCISEDVANQVANKIKWTLSEIPRAQALTKIKRPMRVFVINLPWESHDDAAVPATEGSIARESFRRQIVPTAGERPFRAGRKAVAGISMIAILVLAFLTWWMVRPRIVAFGFQERDWIVICNFENLTGDPVFDKSLDTALRVSITQSRYVNVVPKSRIEQVLRRMTKDPSTPVDEPIGREIAQREGLKILLVPSITGVAGTYAISCTLEDPASGAALKSATVAVKNKAEVLNALDELSQDTRRTLGESVNFISGQSKKLSQVTTASLEALKQYSLAIENHSRGNFREARTYSRMRWQSIPSLRPPRLPWE